MILYSNLVGFGKSIRHFCVGLELSVLLLLEKSNQS